MSGMSSTLNSRDLKKKLREAKKKYSQFQQGKRSNSSGNATPASSRSLPPSISSDTIEFSKTLLNSENSMLSNENSEYDGYQFVPPNSSKSPTVTTTSLSTFEFIDHPFAQSSPSPSERNFHSPKSSISNSSQLSKDSSAEHQYVDCRNDSLRNQLAFSDGYESEGEKKIDSIPSDVRMLMESVQDLLDQNNNLKEQIENLVNQKNNSNQLFSPESNEDREIVTESISLIEDLEALKPNIDFLTKKLRDLTENNRELKEKLKKLSFSRKDVEDILIETEITIPISSENISHEIDDENNPGNNTIMNNNSYTKILLENLAKLTEQNQQLKEDMKILNEQSIQHLNDQKLKELSLKEVIDQHSQKIKSLTIELKNFENHNTVLANENLEIKRQLTSSTLVESDIQDKNDLNIEGQFEENQQSQIQDTLNSTLFRLGEITREKNISDELCANLRSLLQKSQQNLFEVESQKKVLVENLDKASMSLQKANLERNNFEKELKNLANLEKTDNERRLQMASEYVSQLKEFKIENESLKKKCDELQRIINHKTLELEESRNVVLDPSQSSSLLVQELKKEMENLLKDVPLDTEGLFIIESFSENDLSIDELLKRPSDIQLLRNLFLYLKFHISNADLNIKSLENKSKKELTKLQNFIDELESKILYLNELVAIRTRQFEEIMNELNVAKSQNLKLQDDNLVLTSNLREEQDRTSELSLALNELKLQLELKTRALRKVTAELQKVLGRSVEISNVGSEIFDILGDETDRQFKNWLEDDDDESGNSLPELDIWKQKVTDLSQENTRLKIEYQSKAALIEELLSKIQILETNQNDAMQNAEQEFMESRKLMKENFDKSFEAQNAKFVSERKVLEGKLVEEVNKSNGLVYEVEAKQRLIENLNSEMQKKKNLASSILSTDIDGLKAELEVKAIEIEDLENRLNNKIQETDEKIAGYKKLSESSWATMELYREELLHKQEQIEYLEGELRAFRKLDMSLNGRFSDFLDTNATKSYIGMNNSRSHNNQNHSTTCYVDMNSLNNTDPRVDIVLGLGERSFDISGGFNAEESEFIKEGEDNEKKKPKITDALFAIVIPMVFEFERDVEALIKYVRNLDQELLNSKIADFIKSAHEQHRNDNNLDENKEQTIQMEESTKQVSSIVKADIDDRAEFEIYKVHLENMGTLNEELGREIATQQEVIESLTINHSLFEIDPSTIAERLKAEIEELKKLWKQSISSNTTLRKLIRKTETESRSTLQYLDELENSLDNMRESDENNRMNLEKNIDEAMQLIKQLEKKLEISQNQLIEEKQSYSLLETKLQMLSRENQDEILLLEETHKNQKSSLNDRIIILESECEKLSEEERTLKENFERERELILSKINANEENIKKEFLNRLLESNEIHEIEIQRLIDENKKMEEKLIASELQNKNQSDFEEIELKFRDKLTHLKEEYRTKIEQFANQIKNLKEDAFKRESQKNELEELLQDKELNEKSLTRKLDEMKTRELALKDVFQKRDQQFQESNLVHEKRLLHELHGKKRLERGYEKIRSDWEVQLKEFDIERKSLKKEIESYKEIANSMLQEKQISKKDFAKLNAEFTSKLEKVYLEKKELDNFKLDLEKSLVDRDEIIRDLEERIKKLKSHGLSFYLSSIIF
ncbi:hypothetical protein HK096_008811 [Nowakowskiella sp. JEL0078]|nr:hypothetical protein HK096_008811 [Nowakowskiella sp. JEL0078]